MLYSYRAPEDTAAVDTCPVLGFDLEVESEVSEGSLTRRKKNQIQLHLCSIVYVVPASGLYAIVPRKELSHNNENGLPGIVSDLANPSLPVIFAHALKKVTFLHGTAAQKSMPRLLPHLVPVACCMEESPDGSPYY